jgi:hypothetical protein
MSNGQKILIRGEMNEFSKRPLKLRILTLFLGLFKPKITHKNFGNSTLHII